MTASNLVNGRQATPFGLAAARILNVRLDRKARAKLQRGDNPRSGQPVWRNSYYENTIEHRIWRPIGDVRRGKRTAGAVIKAARTFERESRWKRKGEERRTRRGLLGEVGIEVLEALWELVDFATGRLEPAINTIADQLGRSYSAVHAALKRLRAHGWLHWVRRSRPVDDPTPGGQQVEQITNAYALLIPKELERFLERAFNPRLPECDRWRRDQEREEWQCMLSQLTCREFIDATWNGDSLAGETVGRIEASLRRIADALDKGESSRCGETGVL